MLCSALFPMSYVLTFNFQSNLGERKYLEYFILMNDVVNLDRLPLQKPTQSGLSNNFVLYLPCQSHISQC